MIQAHSPVGFHMKFPRFQRDIQQLRQAVLYQISMTDTTVEGYLQFRNVQAF